MILLQQNNVNSSIFTLSEKTTIVNPYYLFEFISQDTNISKIFGLFRKSNLSIFLIINFNFIYLILLT